MSNTYAIGGKTFTFPIPPGWTLDARLPYADQHGLKRIPLVVTDGRCKVTFELVEISDEWISDGWILSHYAMVQGPGYGRQWLSGNALRGLCDLRWKPWVS